MSSIFVTSAGEAKLGGVELACGRKESISLLPDVSRHFRHVDSREWPPEISSPSAALSWPGLCSLNVWAVDSFMVAAVLAQLYRGGHHLNARQQQQPLPPRELTAFFQSAASPSPNARPDPAGLILGPREKLFHTKIGAVAEGLDSIAAMEEKERDSFLASLMAIVGDFPDAFVANKIVPELASLLGMQGKHSLEAVRLLFYCAKRLHPDILNKSVAPIIALLFARPDRAVRMVLLESIPSILDSLDRQFVQESIYTQLISGFSDPHPILREQTLRASLSLAPKLTSRQLNNELLRLYAKLQTDEQGGIRANTIICLGKVAPLLEDSTRSKVLPAAFSRALRDPFVPARSAALLATSVTLESLPATQIASMLLPAVTPLLLDEDSNIRALAKNTCANLLEKVHQHASTMKDSPPPAKESVPSPNSSASTPQMASTPSRLWGIATLADRLMSTAVIGSHASEEAPAEKPKCSPDSLLASPQTITTSVVKAHDGDAAHQGHQPRKPSMKTKAPLVRSISRRIPLADDLAPASASADGWDCDTDLGAIGDADETCTTSLHSGSGARASGPEDALYIAQSSWQEDPNPWDRGETFESNAGADASSYSLNGTRYAEPASTFTASGSRPMSLGRKKDSSFLFDQF